MKEKERSVIKTLSALSEDNWDRVLNVPVAPGVDLQIRMILLGAAAERLISEGEENLRDKIQKRLIAEMESGSSVSPLEKVINANIEALSHLTPVEIEQAFTSFDASYKQPYPLSEEKKSEPALMLELVKKATYATMLLMVERALLETSIPDFMLGESKEEDKPKTKEDLVAKELASRKNTLLNLPMEKIVRRLREFYANTEAIRISTRVASLWRVWSACRLVDNRDERLFDIGTAALADTIALGEKVEEKMLALVHDNQEVLDSLISAYESFSATPTIEELEDAAKDPFRNRPLQSLRPIGVLEAGGDTTSSLPVLPSGGEVVFDPRGGEA